MNIRSLRNGINYTYDGKKKKKTGEETEMKMKYDGVNCMKG